MGPNLGEAVESTGQGRAAPAWAVTDQMSNTEQFGSSHEHGVGLHVLGHNVPTLTRCGRGTQIQASPLTDGVSVGPLVCTHLFTGDRINNVSWRGSESFVQPRRGITIGNETDVVTVRLVGHE